MVTSSKVNFMYTAQNWRHMLVPRGSGNKTSSGILDHLQSVQQLTSDNQQTVAVVQSAADESVHKFCCRLRRQRLLDRSQLTQLEETGPAESSNMIRHVELTVEQNAKVVNDA